MCWSQEDKYMLFVGPDTHFLLLESCLDVETWNLLVLRYTSKGKIPAYIFFAFSFSGVGVATLKEPNISEDWTQESWGQIPCQILHIPELSTET